MSSRKLLVKKTGKELWKCPSFGEFDIERFYLNSVCGSFANRQSPECCRTGRRLSKSEL